MINLFVDGSRYLMILLMAVYTYLNFRYFSVGEEKKRRLCARQNRLMLLMHFLAYMVIYIKTEDPRMAAFYGAQVIFFIAYILLYRLFYPNSSRILVNNVCMLLCVGFIILSRLSFGRAARQFIIVAVFAVIAWIIPMILGRVWQLSKIPWVYGLTGLGLLTAVYFVGDTSFGAQLSISVSGMSVQPSEFVKILFVLFVAAMFYRSTGFKQVAVTTAVAAAHVLILVASKDLGSGLIFFVTYLTMLFVATSNWLYLGAGLLSGCGAAVLAYRLFSHVRVRVSAWRNPWADIDNTGYQITQSLFAIGTGSWFGMGLYQGMPGKIPVVSKDFVFAAISEEMGAMFAVCVLLICLGCFLQFVMISSEMQASFYRLTAFGLGIMYITQVFLAVGGTIKFIPSTGVTLPLISYGGSSVVSTLILFGVIQGVYVLKREEEEE
ncbi:MAG: FtsW/RodA/SpoVE family cell cycle protein [Hungatella sp.]|nr:FtsW/RodA/SpoVE family cell cycle protein [Hungatella sp.]